MPYGEAQEQGPSCSGWHRGQAHGWLSGSVSPDFQIKKSALWRLILSCVRVANPLTAVIASQIIFTSSVLPHMVFLEEVFSLFLAKIKKTHKNVATSRTSS